MAFITAETRSSIVELAMGMLNQAPSTELLTTLIGKSTEGASLQDLADYIATTDAFTAEYPATQTAREFATEMFGKLITGGTLAADINTAVIDILEGLLNNGTTKAEGFFAVIDFLANPANVLHPDLGDIAQAFQNRADAAEYFSVTKELGGLTQQELAGAIASVTSDAATLTAANAAADATASANGIVSGSTFTLTTGVDVGTSKSFVSLPDYTPGGNDFVNSLQDEDVLTGNGDNTSLTATIGSINDAAESIIAPTLNGIETVNLKFTHNGSAGLNMQYATGAESVNITGITQTGSTGTVDSMEGSVTGLSISNANRDNNVTFNYREGEATGSAEELTLDLTNVRVGVVQVNYGEGADAAEDENEQFETINVDTAGNFANVDSLSLFSDAGSTNTDATNQLINFTAGVDTEINALNVGGATKIKIDVNGGYDFAVTANDRGRADGVVDAAGTAILGLDVADGAFISGQLNEVEIVGSGTVTLNNVGSEGRAVEFDVAASRESADNDRLGASTDGNTSGLYINASTATGDVRVSIADGADNDNLVQTGSGNDTIIARGGLNSAVTTGEGNDNVFVKNGANADVNVSGLTDIDTGAGDDFVRLADMGAFGDNPGQLANSGLDSAAQVDLGAGDDSMIVGSLGNAVSWNDGVLNDANVDDVYQIIGASITAGEGDDSVTQVGTIAENATISMGAGADTFTNGLAASATILAADTDANRSVLGNTAATTATGTDEVDADGAVDRVGATVDMGAGDDTITITDASSLTTTAHTIVGTDAVLAGGADTDVLNVNFKDVVTVATATSAADTDPGVTGVQTDINATITGVETVNLTADNQIDAATSTAVYSTAARANDDVETDAAITFDVLRADGDLSAINLTSNETAMQQAIGSEVYEAGQVPTFTLQNLREDVALTLTLNEATGVDGTQKLADDTLLAINTSTGAVTRAAAADVNLDINVANGAATNNTVTLTANAGTGLGDGEFDLNIVLRGTSTDLVDNAASTTDDDLNLIENVAIVLADAGSHSINMNGWGDDDFGAPAVAADSTTTASTSFQVWSGAAADKSIAVDSVNADTIAFRDAAGTGVIAADVTLLVNTDNNYNITTGSGDDLLDMRLDTVRSDDDVTAVDRADVIAAGDGRDTMMVTADNNLSTNDLTAITSVSTVVNDDVFENITGLEIITVDTNSGAGTQQITLNEAAMATGIDTINLIDGVAHAINLVIGNDFSVSSAAANGELTTSDSALVINAAAHTAGTTLLIESKDDDTDVDNVNLDVRVSSQGGATLAFANTGGVQSNVEIRVTAQEAVATTIAETAAGSGTDGSVDLDVDASGEIAVATGVSTNSIDKIVLVDSADTNAAESALTVTVDSEWVAAAIEVDASALANTDSATDTTGTTGGMTFSTVAGDAADFNTKGTAFTVRGTQNNDTITTLNVADTVFGNGGDDTINTAAGADTIDGGAGIDTIDAGSGADVIDGGAGADLITGGTGADTITGGAGADDFIYTAVTQSYQSQADTITDFATGSDDISISLTVANASVVNLGRFASVASSGDGDNSLDGSGAAARLLDGYYSASGQLAIDVDGDGDITDVNDIVINSANAIAASDVNWNVTIAGGANTVRLGQGVDNITTGAGNDTFVIVGAISAAQAAQYETAGAGVVGTNTTVLQYADLLSVRTATEGNTGDAIAAGAGTDILHVYGAVDLSGVDIDSDNDGTSEIETIVVHSALTMDSDQFDAFVAAGGRFVMTSDTAHAITVTAGAAANTTTAGEILARIVVNGANTATSLRVVGSSAATEIVTATYNAANSRMEVATNTSATAGAAGTALNGLGGAASDALSVAAAAALSGAGVTGYTVTDTYTNVQAVQGTATLTDAAANSVTATGVTGNISAAAVGGIDKLELANAASATVTEAQYELISAATGANTVTLSADTTGLDIFNDIETTSLAAAGTSVYTISTTSAANVDVTGAAVTVQQATIGGTYTGTISEADALSTLTLLSGADISGATIDADMDDVTFTSGGSFTMTVLQDAAAGVFDGTITAAGTETINIADAGTFTAFDAVEVYVAAAGGNVLDADADTTTFTGGAGVDHLQGTVAIISDITFTGAGGVDIVTFDAAETITAAALANISGVETVNFGQVANAANAITLVNGIVNIDVDTTNGDITITGTNAQFDALATITDANAAGTNLTFSDTASIDLSSSELAIDGQNLDVITLTGNGNSITINATNIAKIGSDVVAAGTGDTLVLEDTSTVTDNIFNAFEVLTAGTGNINITDAGLDVARTINGSAGNNSIILNGVAAAKTVDLSSGGTDTVTVAMDATATTTVSGFTSGDDVFNVITAADGAANVTFNLVSTTGFTATSAATDASQGIVLVGSSFQISGALTQTGDAGAVEAAIVAAGLVGINTTNDDNEFLMFAIDNGTDTGIYRVQVASGGADVGFNAADDMDNITLVGILQGVTTDGLVAADII